MNVQGASEAYFSPSNVASPLASLPSFASNLASLPGTLASLPGTLWRLYVDYLWNYDANSWVAHAAYSMRVMAVLLMLPITVLTMLDIASYVIARTLGVIDDTRASTSDKLPPPIIRIHAASRRNTLDQSSESTADSPYASTSASSSPAHDIAGFPASSDPSDPNAPSSSHSGLPTSSDPFSNSQPFNSDLASPTPFPPASSALPTEYSFSDDEESLHLPGYEGNLKLSGYGVFSPAASQPGSPVLSRKGLPGSAAGSVGASEGRSLAGSVAGSEGRGSVPGTPDGTRSLQLDGVWKGLNGLKALETPDGTRSVQLGDEDGLVFRGKKRGDGEEET
ncbi:uncharacterized protein SCHCODRAFT_02634404 [Schizophyllum commune H4-8]|nr:uncharacterized protein SCHCODRAFT_02634404 [Schizophyllum commune H4-8]KAI5889394.1 hypothetical protein SCHCODRAFT_02634404 [Schizophyllum commune H4-8]